MKSYIVAPYRSAVGKAFKGSLAHKRPDDLCADIIKGVLKKYHQTEIPYANKEAPLIAWIASIEGRDNLHEEEHLPQEQSC